MQRKVNRPSLNQIYFMLFSNKLFLYALFGKAALQTTANCLKHLIIIVLNSKDRTQMLKKLANVEKVMKCTNNLSLVN